MRRVAAAVGVALALAGCGTQHPHTATVLRLASADPAGIDHVPGLRAFVTQASRLSRGALRIEVDERWARGDAQDGPRPDRERALVRAVARGDADLGSAHTSTLHRLGVRTLDVLDAPLLIGDQAAQARVLRSSLPETMLAGTRRAGVEGIALLAGRILRPVGRGRPLRGPHDYVGLPLRTPDSAIDDAVARALGAHPVHDVYKLVGFAWQEGRLRGLEADPDTLFFELAPQFGAIAMHPPAWLTTNVGLAPATTALIANPRRLRMLTPQQRGWLRTAARRARAASLHDADDDARVLSELCAIGVRLVTASRAQLAELRRAAAPAYERLRRDGSSGGALARVAALTRGTHAPAVRRCPALDGRQALPDGVYRARMTAGDLSAAGAGSAEDVPAILTLTLDHGRWRLERREPGLVVDHGRYTGTWPRVIFLEAGNPARMSVVVERGFLRFHVVTAGDYRFYRSRFERHRWLRIR